MFVLDTDTLSLLFRGHARVTGEFTVTEEVAITLITRIEMDTCSAHVADLPALRIGLSNTRAVWPFRPSSSLNCRVIDRLNPLKSEKLIVLADPQRMIRAGARAVGGWAKRSAQPNSGSSVERRR